MTRIASKPTQTELAIPGTPMRYLWSLFTEQPWGFAIILILVTVAEFAHIAVPYLTGLLIDTVTAGQAEVSTVWLLVALYPILLLVVYGCWRTAGFVGAKTFSDFTARSYKRLFSYTLGHSQNYFSNRYAGSVSSNLGSVGQGGEEVLVGIVFDYYTMILAYLITTAFLFSTSPILGLIAVCMLIILLPLNIYLAKHRRPYVVSYTTQNNIAKGYGIDVIGNMAVVRLFAQAKHELFNYGIEIDKTVEKNIKQWKLGVWAMLINQVCIVVFNALMLGGGVYLWSKDELSLGSLVMVIGLMSIINRNLEFLGNMIARFIRSYGEMQAGLKDILVPHEIVDVSEAKQLVVERGEIEWQGVTFGYGGENIFNDFSLTLKSGQKVGLVGGSGAGKTTFVQLLLREQELTKGNILIDGQDISLVTKDSLREKIGVVPQDSTLFHRSLADNISYAKPEASLQEIKFAAAKAHILDFIETLPEGFETKVGERGVKLSGGQRQRVSIARAYLKNAPILILDEATSALDSESEGEVQKALLELMEGKTVVAIAHRLSTLRAMDRILVLEGGRVVEDGTHEELLAQNGVYAKLWAHQAGGFIVE